MKRSKILIALAAVLMLVFCLTGCGGSSGNSDVSGEQKSNVSESTEKDGSDGSSKSDSKDSSTTSSKASSDKSQTSKTKKRDIDEEKTPIPVPDPTPQKQDPPKSSKLVVYFSASHKTEKVAKTLSQALNADIYKIVPKTPYQMADLNTNDPNARCRVEMDDPDCRPELFETIDYFDQYDTVFIGYPIWFGEAPRIVSTFVEAHNFEGKTVIPFCTSSSTDIGESAKPLEKQAKAGKWLKGKRLEVNAKGADIKKWADELLK